jgi:Tfp pilus assembly protein PilF
MIGVQPTNLAPSHRRLDLVFSSPKWQARAWKFRGLCLEATAEVSFALQAYQQALALDPEVGVKRKVDQLRKVVSS